MKTMTDRRQADESPGTGETALQVTVRDRTVEERAETEQDPTPVRQDGVSLIQPSLATPAHLSPTLNRLTDASDRFASAIVDALSSHIAILDETGTIIAVNRAWREFALANPPITTNVCEGANYLQVCDTADGPGAEEAAALAEGIRAVMRNQQPSFALEYPCHSPRENRWFLARVTRFAGNGPIRIVVGHVNVTERKLAEEALSAAELRYRSLYEKSRDALMILDPSSFQYVSANPSAIAMFGARDEADIVSRKLWDFSPERQPDGRSSREVSRGIDGVLDREGSHSFEWTHTRIDGTMFPTSVLVTRIECSGETLLQATVRDITLEKQIETERAARLQRQEGISLLQQSLLTPAPLDQKLKSITDSVVRIFDVDFCRIWLIRPGDLCATGCIHAQALDGPLVCRDRSDCLHLAASSGRYTDTDGIVQGRVPLGCYIIGQFASWDDHNIIITDVQNDPRIQNREWARSLGLASYAAFQLRAVGGKTLGVMVIFATHPVASVQLAMLDGLSSTAALVVQEAVAEEERRKAEMERDRFFTQSLNLLCMAGFDGFLRRVNPAFEATLGFSRVELLAEPFLNFIHPDDREATRVEIQGLAQGVPTHSFECRSRCKGGSYKWLLWNATPNLELDGFYATGHDITERKQAEQNTKLLLAELNRSNKELEQFAYVASHDLQEPLRTVASYTQLLARRYKGRLDADADKFIAFAVDGANRMQRLIKDLLAYSRVGTRGKEFAPTDCTTAFDQALTNLKMAIEESRAVVTRGPLPTVIADKLQIGQLLQNMIGNAIKYHGDEPPRVHVSAEKNGSENEWVFSVCDNGIGIDPQYAERIFVIFQRLHTREEYPGTGIGLAICKKIVERHGGRLWVESQLGSGATFHFTIPEGTFGP